MKNSKTLLIIVIILAYVSPLIVFILFYDKPFFESFLSFAAGFIGALVVVYLGKLIKIIRSIYKPESIEFEKLNVRLRIIWAVFCALTSGLLLYHSFNYTPDLGYNTFFILFGIFLMIQGNYQSILPKKMGLNSFAATYANTYGDTFYKKSQKLTGKYEFYFGLLVVIIFLILPNTKQVAVGGIIGILIFYYLGAWWIMYKNTQIIAESEAKSKTK